MGMYVERKIRASRYGLEREKSKRERRWEQRKGARRTRTEELK